MIAIAPHQLAEVNAVGRYILSALDNHLLPALIVQALIIEHGLQKAEADQTCQQIVALMQPAPIPPAVMNATLITASARPATSTRLTLSFLGFCVDFYSNCPITLQLLTALWGDAFTVDSTSATATLCIDIIANSTSWHLLRDGELAQTVTNLPSLKSALMQEVLSALHQTRDWAAVLHASAVLIDGKLVLLAGQSGSGKTTLASALIAQGATFFSDDCVPLRSDTLMACAAPGTLGIRPSALPGLPSVSACWQPGKLGGMPGDLRHHTTPQRMTPTREAAASVLVFPLFMPDATPFIQRLDASAALRQLLANGSGIDELTPTNLARWLSWISTMPAWSIRYAQTAQGVSYIADILTGSG